MTDLPRMRARRGGPRRALVAIGICAALLSTCVAPQWAREWQQKQAYAMWQERCKKSGEFVHRTVEAVEGVYLVNVRTRTNFGEQPQDQFELDDPYGNDAIGDDYILNFLQGFYHQRPQTSPLNPAVPPRIGYLFVEAIDPKDGKLYRFTGRFEELWLTNKHHLKGDIGFVLDRKPIDKRSARYGIRFDDISTREEREHWIAGSSLKVVNLETQEVLAERIGYMVDWAQGSRTGGRSPWLLAADNACPSFDRGLQLRGNAPAFTAQAAQTIDFAEKVLKPTRREK